MDIALSKILEPDAMQDLLASVIPSCRIRVTDLTFSAGSADILVALTENPSEFPLGLEVVVSLEDGVSEQRWLLELARRLSLAASCRAIADGTGLGDDASPYWSIVWDRGVAHLADDSHSLYGDGEGGPVRLVRPLELVLEELDGAGFSEAVRRGERSQAPTQRRG